MTLLKETTFIYIYDLCNALDKGIKYLRLKKQPNIFNIGSNNSISSYNLLKYFNDKLGKNKLKFNFTGLIHGEIRKSAFMDEPPNSKKLIEFLLNIGEEAELKKIDDYQFEIK